jgi:hypothetical protein
MTEKNIDCPDDPAKLAAEARDILREIIAHAVRTESGQIVVPYLPLRFALQDRIDRLCVVLEAHKSE